MTKRTGICVIQVPNACGHDTLIFDRQDKGVAEEDRKDFEVISSFKAKGLFERTYRNGGAVFTRTKDERDLHKVKLFEDLEDLALIRPQLGGG
jgi:hypothetical protein